MKTNLFRKNHLPPTPSTGGGAKLPPLGGGLGWGFLVLAMLFAGCSDDDDDAQTPLYAATIQTWTFGDQTWSDRILCPECNKIPFEESYTNPQCRNYTSGRKVFYYYNWAYVDANKDKMCPDPWRVPTYEDFKTLGSNITSLTFLVNAWGYGGMVDNDQSVSAVNSAADYWSSTENSNETDNAYGFDYFSDRVLYLNTDKSLGMQVRCVKELNSNTMD
jgi:hypothetical protein